jgi:uncharacterized protein YdbL (DUF1318 family)
MDNTTPVPVSKTELENIARGMQECASLAASLDAARARVEQLVAQSLAARDIEGAQFSGIDGQASALLVVLPDAE